ncbi:phosphoribosyl-AMP cyclohydrolase [Cohaesibacter sp. ES.047]|uniref:phosphoribosyl-AMP cyclohydrolase n=1 Tax=Cohaesibacter sp. ES.047 TaxID=1798205 RepID=UPI000BB96F65|nr:phosphoribosyl-AMP cyclohydrolase [Cohaesibacter sp. ES.047]SNY94173.1 phosphoribosyl-AMP cyclohydrolase [Cohaesibacter sp. ES.047]
MPTPFFSRDGKDKETIELGTDMLPKFDEAGLIACIVTDADSGDVVMFAYMNEESLRLTLETREAHYWSRSRQELWHKGATSGNVQDVIELRTDCDQDAIWIKVRTRGASANCHQGYKSCFYRAASLDDGKAKLSFTEDKPLFDPAKVYGKH